MFYYNQNDYPNVKYDRPSTSAVETVKTSGCGPVAACIIINSLIGKELYTVSQMAKFSIDNSARDSSGTNMLTLLKAICKANPDFSFVTTTSETQLVAHIKKGGMAICNQGDVYNVFSTAGHYVIAYKMSGSNIEILDPQMYNGKYDAYNRPKRIVKKTTNGCIVTPTEMGKATADRDPAYFLVTYTKPKTSAKAPSITKGQTYTLKAIRGIYNGVGASTGRKKVKDLTADGRTHATFKDLNRNAYLKSGTKVTITETRFDAAGNLWAKIPSGWFVAYQKKINMAFV